MRQYCENIFKIQCLISEKKGNKSHNMTYSSSLQLVVACNFNLIESTSPVPFPDYVTGG